MDSDEPAWMLGFFTGRLHAVFDRETALVFKGVPLTWSVCGAPVVVNTHGAPGPFCSACVRRVGITWVVTGTTGSAGQQDPLDWTGTPGPDPAP
jgi:hypothetical protein